MQSVLGGFIDKNISPSIKKLIKFELFYLCETIVNGIHLPGESYFKAVFPLAKVNAIMPATATRIVLALATLVMRHR
jgi:hypothetical protein